METILKEWEAFATTLLPASENMSALALRDHAPQILKAVALDLFTPQTDDEQAEKSKGRAPKLLAAPETAAQTHAVLRAKHGFDIKQLAGEYRALRASVLRLWTAQCLPEAIDPEDVMRFNEAIDQALAESIEFFSEQVGQSSRRLAAIVDSSDDAIISKNLDGIIQSWNAAAERIFGYTAEEIVGEPILRLIPPELYSEETDIMARIKMGERTDHFETIRRARDGTPLNVSLTISPIKDSGGVIIGASKIARDITARKKAELELVKAREDAERASSLKDEFLATLSHELRTPLNAVLGWASLLRTSKAEGEELGNGLAIIERNAKAQGQIIEDLLDMSRIISGKVRLDVQTVDLPQLLSEAVETVRTAAEAKGIRLQTVIDPHAAPVSGDPNRLQQVFWNLLSNAIKFTPKEGRVQVFLELVNSHLEISVVDTGEGIDPTFLPYVFERFQQADGSTTRKHGGLGLGLAIVKQLVSLHGGSVWAKSGGVGNGATFAVHLPLMVVHPGPEREKRHPRTETAMSEVSPEICLTGAKVLVVDDESDARELVRRLLELAGAEVETAGSASEAFEAICAWNPTVLVSDIGMPEEDGYSLIKRVRNLYPDLPAIALTAYARAEDRTKAINAGFDNHLAKPVNSAELLAVVARLAS